MELQLLLIFQQPKVHRIFINEIIDNSKKKDELTHQNDTSTLTLHLTHRRNSKPTLIVIR
jgi:hypothetical protein